MNEGWIFKYRSMLLPAVVVGLGGGLAYFGWQVAVSADPTRQLRQSAVEQLFADAVIETFYLQSQEYETQVRPVFLRSHTKRAINEWRRKWRASVNRMVSRLEALDSTGVDVELVQTYEQTKETARVLVQLLEHPEQMPDATILALGERLGSEQLEFELECRNKGLKVYASGVGD